MINIDAKLLKALEASTCFGIAHDDTVPECKQCDVKAQCKAKVDGANIQTPKSKPLKSPAPDNVKIEKKVEKPAPSRASSEPVVSTPKPAKKEQPVKKQEKKEDKTTDPNIPDFKNMDLDSLVSLAKQRNVEWKDYGNDNITRMRLIMSLKKSY